MVFMRNDETGDARICGSLASLVGLESAQENGEPALISSAVNKILLLHSLILSFGGIPLVYNGDAFGVVNDYSYRDDPSKSNDNRWIHRPKKQLGKSRIAEKTRYDGIHFIQCNEKNDRHPQRNVSVRRFQQPRITECQ
jgi:amylosucrase